MLNKIDITLNRGRNSEGREEKLKGRGKKQDLKQERKRGAFHAIRS